MSSSVNVNVGSERGHVRVNDGGEGERSSRNQVRGACDQVQGSRDQVQSSRDQVRGACDQVQSACDQVQGACEQQIAPQFIKKKRPRGERTSMSKQKQEFLMKSRKACIADASLLAKNRCNVQGRVFLMLVSLVCCFSVWGNETISYGSNAVTIPIRSNAPTLAYLEAPIYSVNCQPSTIVAIEQAEKIQDLIQYGGLEGSERSNEIAEKKQDEINYELAKIIKLIPLQNKGQTTCDLGLTNHESIRIILKPEANIIRPSFSLKKETVQIQKSLPDTKLSGLNNFRKYLIHWLQRPSKDSLEKFSTGFAQYTIKRVVKTSQGVIWEIDSQLETEQRLPIPMLSKQSKWKVAPNIIRYGKWVKRTEKLYSLIMATSQEIDTPAKLKEVLP